MLSFKRAYSDFSFFVVAWLYLFQFLKKGTFEFIITLLKAVLTVVWSCTVLLRRAARCTSLCTGDNSHVGTDSDVV